MQAYPGYGEPEQTDASSKNRTEVASDRLQASFSPYVSELVLIVLMLGFQGQISVWLWQLSNTYQWIQ